MSIEKNLISVIMSNYNTPERYLREAIESVLGQTYNNFEFIIVDDCSTDNSLKIIESYSDPRITIIRNDINLGITKSLNKGLAFAKGEFVARMDADDICYENRFEKQIDFLKLNPDCIVCGTWIEQIDEYGENPNKKTLCRVIPKKDIYSIYLLFGNYPNIAHPSAMFRRKLLIDNNVKYDEAYLLAQDYKMWVDCNRFGECANVPEVLLKYRVHEKAASQEKRDLQRSYALKNINAQLKRLDLDLPEEYESIHMGLLYGRHGYDIKYKRWIELLIKQNRKKHIYNPKDFETILLNKWAEILYFSLKSKTGFRKKIEILLQTDIRCWKFFISMRKKRRNPL